MSALENLTKIMNTENISVLRGTYSGCGDSGEVDVTVVYIGHAKEEELDMGDPLREKLCLAVWAVVQNRFPGFEQDQGAEGNIEIFRESHGTGFQGTLYHTPATIEEDLFA